MATTTETITQTAKAFFDACETGKGWAACSAYCQPNAGFAAQAEPLADLDTLEGYTEWMKGQLVIIPAPAPVTPKLRVADHGPWTKSLLTA
jgi:hypothetical protein